MPVPLLEHFDQRDEQAVIGMVAGRNYNPLKVIPGKKIKDFIGPCKINMFYSD